MSHFSPLYAHMFTYPHMCVHAHKYTYMYTEGTGRVTHLMSGRACTQNWLVGLTATEQREGLMA